MLYREEGDVSSGEKPPYLTCPFILIRPAGVCLGGGMLGLKNIRGKPFRKSGPGKGG